MNMVQKVVGALIVILALVIAIVPQFTNCQYAKSMAAPTTVTTMGGTATTMMAGGQATTPTTVAKAATTTKPRCFYTARAEIAVGVALFFIGAFMLVSGRRETWRALSVLGFIQGLFVILLPTVLIGICMKNTMTCQQQMEPVLYAAGGVVIVLSLAAFIVNEMRGRKSGGTEPAV